MTIFAPFQQSIVNRKWHGFQMIIIAQNITKQGFFNSLGSLCSTIVENPLQIAPFLCKTKPILKSYQCPQPLLHKQLTKNSALFGNRKTKPIQSQTKPISKNAKMNANYFVQRDYEQKMAFFRQKNKANSKPISKTSKNEHKLS